MLLSLEFFDCEGDIQKTFEPSLSTLHTDDRASPLL